MITITIWTELFCFLGGLALGTIFGMYVHYYHGVSLDRDREGG